MNARMEQVLADRKARRDAKPAVIRITPSQVSLYSAGPDADGYLCRFVFSGRGTVKRVVINGTPADKLAEVEIFITLGMQTTSLKLNVGKQVRQQDVDLQVEVGTLVALRVNSGGLTDVSVGLLWLPDTSEAGYA